MYIFNSGEKRRKYKYCMGDHVSQKEYYLSALRVSY